MRVMGALTHSLVCLILITTAGSSLASSSYREESEATPFPDSALREYAASQRWDLPPAAESRTSFPAWDTQSRFSAESRGQGGQTGFQQRSFTASNGKSSQFKVVIPSDIGPERSYGMLIYLHGDGGNDYDWFFNNLRKVALKHHLIPVAVLSPTANGNGPSWWWDADRNAQFLDELIRSQLLARYNINKAKVIFTGASGGPTFLSGPWIRHFAHQYRGGSINFCGGMVSTGYSLKTDPDFRRNFMLFYYNGTEDFLMAGAQQAAAFYRASGFRVSAEYPEGIGHCGFSGYMDQLMDQRVQEILGAASYRRR